MSNATQLIMGVWIASIVGCGDNQQTSTETPIDSSVDEIDATMTTGPCWPDDGQAQKGWATLGTGRDDFEAMPAMLPIEYGLQDGFDFIAHVKMNGLVPGNPTNVFDPNNPRTRIRAYFTETNLPLNYYAKCPYRMAYVPTSDGNYQLPTGVGIIFETCWRAQHLIGKQVRIELEVVDRDGAYSRDSVTVTLAEPSGFYPKNEPVMPGCVH